MNPWHILKLLLQILVSHDVNDVDLTSTKLRSLFATDLFMYLGAEQLEEVVNALLTKAVRLYGDIHDVILEIVEILQGN